MIIRYLFIFLLCYLVSCSYNKYSFESKSNYIKKIVSIVQNHHVSPKAINEELSADMFLKFLNNVDNSKLFFTQVDVDRLRKYETTLDNELLEGKTIFLDNVNSLFRKRLAWVKRMAHHWLVSDFDIFSDDYYVNDCPDFSKNAAELSEKWRVKIKHHYIEELYTNALANPRLTLLKNKSIAKSRTKKYFDKYFESLGNRSQQEVFDLYINSYVGLNDFQSKFLSIEAKKQWDNKFYRSYVGVGMMVKIDRGGYPVVQNVSFGGPAWKTRKIDKGDLLLAIKNEDEYIDIAGFNLSSVLNLLKGKEGSLVTLKIKNTRQEVEEVMIQRASIKYDRVKAFVLELDKVGRKIGYIKLPRFYAGEKGSASDVFDAIAELNKNKVTGLLFDIRDNKGGSSREANKIIGYFLKGGVCSYFLSKDGRPRAFEDNDTTALFEEKLIVMVNSNSASASELFAGTIQDYGRGIIVGSRSFGKGSFQRFYNVTANDDSTSIGSIKLTHGSFYSGGGHSNQLKGVIPDIAFPTESMYIPTGERALENALSFPDLPIEVEIQKEDIIKIALLKKNSNERIANSPFFISIQDKAMKFSKKQPINLNYEKYKKREQTSRGELLFDFPFQVTILDKNKYDPEAIEYWEHKVNKDPYVYESLLIMKDFLKC